MADANRPDLSVVIPTLGRPFVVRTLTSLAAAHGFSKLEILLIGKIPDVSVAERVRAISMQYPQIRHIAVSFETGDSSEKKNAGLRAASADIVAFLDDDVIVAPDWAEKILTPFSQPDVGLVSGPSLVPADIPLPGRLAGLALSSYAAGYVARRYLRQQEGPHAATWSQIIGCNMVYRKSVLIDIGGFNPRFWPGEEMIASYRTAQRGYRIIFHPQACVDHYPRTSVMGFMRQMFGYGATRIRLIRAGVTLEPMTLIPGLWLLSLVILLPGAWVSYWVAMLLAVNIGAYALIDIAITMMKVMATRRAIDLLLLGYIPLMHLSYGLGEWIELLMPGRDLSEQRG
ncbi:MAG: glycosyltransferase [Verrucomicrobia bacterium]|nr:glycosyltransferase [Verrucomicrobiota bacterium]MCG2678968.1 glycosyltransferase [Kiritimatiellia bacterium]MBU4247624.1 glycosyltransferase [Verrucomicrobiota bacterium]MBU4290805.1 glycosyltransferase [Verrucomicrobiota bacterium]MBU4428351.1 glycosyltransferase [Verrucomicrobiota bacterium]